MFHQHSNCIIILTTLLVSSFFLPSVTSRPQCFAQPAPGRPPLFRADLQDCLAIADIILKGDKVHAPMHWSRVSGMGWRLPTLWDIWGSSCFVSMDMLPEYEGDVVVFAPDVVAKTAVNIINWCQTSAWLPRLGGREETGPELKTIVIMAGKVPEQGPRPPGHPRLRVSFPRFNSSITITAILASTPQQVRRMMEAYSAIFARTDRFWSSQVTASAQYRTSSMATYGAAIWGGEPFSTEPLVV